MAVTSYYAPTPQFNTVLTALYRRVLESEPVEQTYREHRLLSMLEKEDGARYMVNGGRTLHIPISSLGSTRAVPVRGGSTIPLTNADNRTMAEYTMSHYTIGLTVWGTQLAEARGPDKLFDLMKSVKTDGLLEMADKLDTDLWASSAVSNGLSGIRLAFPTDGGNSSTTYGGHAGATNTFWRSKTITTGGTATTALIPQLDTLEQNIRTEKSKKIDYYVTTANLETIYKRVARTYHQITTAPTAATKRVADLGYGSAAHNGVPVLDDNTCPAGFVYGLSMAATKWAYDPDFNYSTDEFVELTAGQQYGKAGLMHVRGCFVVNERRCNGQISGLTES
jgi:hypothetical protein